MFPFICDKMRVFCIKIHYIFNKITHFAYLLKLENVEILVFVIVKGVVLDTYYVSMIMFFCMVN